MFNLVKSESKRFAPSHYNILLVRLSFLTTLHEHNIVSVDNSNKV